MSDGRSAEVLKKALIEIKRLKSAASARNQPIAIVGASCRFPGEVSSVDAYWKMLMDGTDAITEVPRSRWDVDSFYDPDPKASGRMYARGGGFIKNHDRFDARFFGISPREAKLMDPQQRLLLEVTWEAFENAGIPHGVLTGSPAGVYIGVSSNDYFQLLLNTELGDREGGYVLTGVAPSIAAGRISHALGLRGPNLLVDTACSSSLAATYLAAKALRAGECDVAVAGGVNLILSPGPTVAFCQLRALSPESRCRTFDASANGYVRGEGCAIVVLKRLQDALDNHDRIVGVIRGVATNHDGTSSGVTVPNGGAQQDVIRDALEDARLSPVDVGYLEAHGTGTPLGDPVELRAASGVYCGAGERRAPLWMGSVKTNFGHLEAAAGVAGLLKAALAVERGTIPQHLHYRSPNPHADLDELEIRVPKAAVRWASEDAPRRAGVSAFGFSGTNAHVIVEAPPAQEDHIVCPEVLTLLLSAKSENALRTQCDRWTEELEAAKGDLDVLVAKLQTAALRRTHHPHRIAVVGRTGDELLAELRANAAGGPSPALVRSTVDASDAPLVAFIYSGQGTPWVGMGQQLFDTDQTFEEAFAEVELALEKNGIVGLREVIQSSDASTLTSTIWAQPAIFAMQVALSALWRSNGIVPTAVAGHSIGEVAAAHVAGIIDLETAARVVAVRARLMNGLTGCGRMVAVRIPAAELESRWDDIWVAALNSPSSTVIAGSDAAIARALAELKASGIEASDLGVPYAFHSPQMDPILPDLREHLGQIETRAARIPFYSTVAGESVDGDQLDAEYWLRNVRDPVRFSDALLGMYQSGYRAFVEIGPHPALSHHVEPTVGSAAQIAWSLRKRRDAAQEFALNVARLHVAGAAVEWKATYRGRVRPTTLPSYSWDHKRYWAAPEPLVGGVSELPAHPLLGPKERDAGDSSVAFTSAVSTHDAPYLSDHAMHGRVILPAAGFLEICRAAVSCEANGSAVLLENVVIKAPLLLSDDQPINVRTEIGHGGAISISSGTEDDWLKHVEGTGRPFAQRPTGHAGPPPIDRDGANPEPVHDQYARGQALGAQLGPSFQVLQDVRRDVGCATARAVLATSIETDSYGLHPALLDACFQVAFAALDDDALRGQVFLPVAIESAWLGAAGEGPHTATFSCTRVATRGFEGDGALYDVAGRVVASLRGVRFQQANLAQLTSASAPARLLYERRWVNSDLVKAGLTSRAPRSWVVLHSGERPQNGLISALADGLERQGQRVELADAANGIAEADDVVLFSLPPADALAALSNSKAQRIWAITENAIAQEGHEVDEMQAAVWGLCRSAFLEFDANVAGCLIDIRRASVTDLIQILIEASHPGELSLSGRVLRSAQVAPAKGAASGPTITLQPGATYVVSGGLGALGLLTAEWLVQGGARRIALLGRSKPSAEVSQRINAMEASGARIIAVQVDVAHAESVESAVASLEAELGPVTGVVHAAGVLEDALARNASNESLERALAVKLEGARALADATAHRKLSFFVGYSSIVTLLGSPGQSGYSAANAALEAFAQNQRARGIRAFSLSFGPWKSGMGSELNVASRGLNRLEPVDALGALALVLADQPTNIAVAAIDPGRLAAAFGQRRPSALEPIFREAPETRSAAQGQLEQKLKTVEEHGRISVAAEFIIKEARPILGLSSDEELDLHTDLFELGMDSLMALELRDRLEQSIGRAIPQSATFENRDPNALAELVVSLLDSGERQRQVAIVADVANRHESFPLSDVQTAYWVGRTRAFELGGTSCHYYGEFERDGLDVERLSHAWRALVQRHEMLRTVVDDDGRQRILESAPPYTIDIRDLREHSPAEVERALAKSYKEMSHQTFEPSRWPLFDLRLHRMRDGRTRLHISFDLLILDVFSFVTLLAEWRRLYEGESLAPIGLSFRDYMVWEEAQKESEAYEASLNYWRDRVETLPPPPELPLRQSPQSIDTPRFSRRAEVLSQKNWTQLKALGRAQQLTPSMLVCAAYAQVIERFSKEKSFTLNLTLFNRAPVDKDVQRVIGDFTSLILLEVDHTKRRSFLENAKALQARLHADLPHRQVSGVRVLREWGKAKGRTISAPVIFTSGIGMTDAVQAEADRTDEWLGTSLNSVSQTPQVWLDHQVYERGGKLLMFWDCVEELFPPGLLDDMFEAYVTLLRTLATDPEHWARTSLVPLSGPQKALRDRVNQTEGPCCAESMFAGFVRQADLQPDAPAILTSQSTTTYDELAKASFRIARTLEKLGVGRGAHVAIVMRKSPQQIAAVLGTLMAGAAYVPVSPQQPDERLRYILEQTDAQWIFSDEPLSKAATGGRAAYPLNETPFPAESSEPADTRVAPEDLAYVIFTSGSTGRPKGVMIDHQSAANTCADINDRFALTNRDRTFGISDLGFDLSVYDVFGTFAAGAALVLPNEDALKDPSHWLELLHEHEVSVWNSVPALMKMLVEYVRGSRNALPTSLRLSLLSGDWVPVDLPGMIASLGPKVDVVSLGGATEASIWSIAYRIEDVDPNWSSIPYGRPLRNQTFHVLDQHRADAPNWVPGELYIGGTGVALGYANEPEKTAAKFVQHPTTGSRLYRTGDLGRYLPSGDIEFLGREDHQVKIQGYRIELGEIQSVLCEHPDVAEAIVTAPEIRRRERQIVAYVVGRNNADLDESTLELHLGRKLAPYMIPKWWMILDRLPLSRNGKVDRDALPPPKATAVTHKAPTTELERKIYTAWRRALPGVEMGVDESFFDLGGDSQGAVRAMLEVRHVLGREVPIRALFERPTIEGLAKALGDGSSAAPGLVPDERLYARFARRGVGERLDALGTNKTYVRAVGNSLFYGDGNDEVEIVDMVGGFGSTLLGHNHPEMLKAASEIAAKAQPFAAQYSNNVTVGRLCRALSDRLQSATMSPFVVTLASTGTEAVEAAIKHAKMEYRARALAYSRSSESVAAVILDQARRSKAAVEPEIFEKAQKLLSACIESLDDLQMAMSRHNDSVFDDEPVFLALEHAFHGMTTGALGLTASPDFRAPFHWMGVRTRLISQSADRLAEVSNVQQSQLFALGFNASGEVCIKAETWVRIAGLFVEPIQGEGGIRPLDREFLEGARTTADTAGFPIIVDEIQCGMGRAGRFTAAEVVGLSGDYYTFSKSLGGGVAKISAMAVRESRYHPEFGYVHGSTFAEDTISAGLALKALEIIDRDRLIEACALKGRLFKQKLEKLRAEHPSVIEAVRGEGLMLGIQIATQERSRSMVLRVVSQSDPEMFNQLLAGFLLNEKNVRIAPTKTRSTIRLLPSAYIEEHEMDGVVSAFKTICEIIERLNVGRLLRHLVVPEANSADPVRDWRDVYPSFTDVEPRPGEPRVAHIGHIEDDETLLLAEPSMAEIPENRREELLRRLFRFTKPAIGQRMRIETASGDTVHLSLIGLVATSRVIEDMMRSDQREALLDKIQEAVDLAVADERAVIGFGGYTSIATLNCTAVATPRAALTSGNAYTVVLAVEGAIQGALEKGIDLQSATVGIVGAAGNIGSSVAKLMAEHAGRLILVGRERQDPRLKSVAVQICCDAEDALLENPESPGVARAIKHAPPVQALLAAGAPIGGAALLDALGETATQDVLRLTDDLNALAQCDVIISCTSTATTVIHAEHLSDRVCVICDVATPKDVDEDVEAQFASIKQLSGGLARLPFAPGVQLNGTHLPPGYLYGCIAETTLLGLDGQRSHFSFGDITTDQVERIRALAKQHGYEVGVDRR